MEGRSQQEFDSHPASVQNQKKDQEGKVNNNQSRVMDLVGAYSAISDKDQLPLNYKRRSLQEFDSRPTLLLNQKKDQERKVNSQSKVMDQPAGPYSTSNKEYLFSNPRRRSQQEFQLDSRLPNHKPAQEQKVNQPNKSSRPVWDCGSSLYDSFELDSFKRQLDSAISCRTMSMPHLSDRHAPPPQPLPPPASATASTTKKHTSNKLSRSIHKLLRSVFKSHNKAGNNDNSFGVVFRVQEPPPHIKDGFYVVYDKTGSLTTIPEVVPHEFDFERLSPEIGALVRRTGSERFTSTSNIGISCA